MFIPDPRKKTLDAIIDDLRKINGVSALVLGGSYATGMATDTSDLDIGIYYDEQEPFDIGEIRKVAKKYSVEDTFTLTDFYAWGPWVNGGAWINTQSGEVDFVYRNIRQVRDTIKKAKDGVCENNYDQQPPFGFSSVIYLAETRFCLPLFDPQHIIQDLKSEVAAYPQRLKHTIVQQSLWSAQFSLWQADKFAAKEDMLNATGCFTRALKNIVDALFALNEQYPMGDKNSSRLIKGFLNAPENFVQRVNDVLTTSPQSLPDSARKLRGVFDDVVKLAGDLYKPYFVL